MSGRLVQYFLCSVRPYNSILVPKVAEGYFRRTFSLKFRRWEKSAVPHNIAQLQNEVKRSIFHQGK